MTTYVEEIQHPFTGELIRLEAADEGEMSRLVALAFDQAAAEHDGEWRV